MCAPWKVCWAWGIATAIACAQSTFSVQLPNGRTYELPLRAIGGYPAASLAHCAILWEGKARLSARGTVLSTPHGVIRAAPLSFFLAWERRDSSHFIQLPVPVQSDGQHLFVSLHGLGEAIAALWEAQAVWDSPTVLRLRYAPAPVVTTSPPSQPIPPPRIAPLPIPPDTAFAPRPPRLPQRESSSNPWLLAALGNSFAATLVEIVQVEAQTLSDTTILLRFRANGLIERYQRPEWQGQQLVVRIPDVLHTAPTLPSLPAIERSEVQRIREFTVYRFSFRSEIRECKSEREGPRTLRFTVLLKGGAATPTQRWELDVIVIDPGHGGEDDGTISINGHAEKTITLRVALKLRRLLHRMLPHVRVVLTRDEDRFVPLYRRGQIANEQQGKLFLSLHCNAAPTKPHPARGVETYVLRPGRTPEAIRVAERENAVIRLEADPSRYKELFDEQRILATLAQSAFMRLSDRLAAFVQQELVSTTGLPDRGIGQAGFYVLMGASMPAVLIEMGFLSNPADERFLISERGQWAIARAIARAIRRYAAEYASLLR